MMKETEFIITNFWQVIASGAVSVVITLIVFWAGIVRHMITKDEVCEMLDTHSPYVKDRQFIMERLAINKEIQAEISNALKHNSEVMNELRVQIATLAKTLEVLEFRINKE